MGRITVYGKSTLKVPHDFMTLTFEIKATGKSLTTLNLLTEHQAEAFLAELDALGIPPTAVQAHGTTISKRWVRDNTEELEQTRTFALEQPLNLALMNRISSAFSKTVRDGSFHHHFEVRNRATVQSTLITQAVADARRQATLIASGLGQPLGAALRVELSSSSFDDELHPRYDTSFSAPLLAKGAPNPTELADQTTPSETQFDLEVKVIWNLGETTDEPVSETAGVTAGVTTGETASDI